MISKHFLINTAVSIFVSLREKNEMKKKSCDLFIPSIKYSVFYPCYSKELVAI